MHAPKQTCLIFLKRRVPILQARSGDAHRAGTKSMAITEQTPTTVLAAPAAQAGSCPSPQDLSCI